MFRIPATGVTTAPETGDRSQFRSAASRISQFHPARPAIVDLFNLYLGINGRGKADESAREPPNKTQKRVTALNIDIPPRDAQFIPDFEQLRYQFLDHEQLYTVIESVLVSLVIQCSSHGPRSKFVLFAIRSLYSIGCINWDSFIPYLLSSVTSAETSVNIFSTTSPQSDTSAASAGGPNYSNIQSPNLESSMVLANDQSSTAISSLRKLSCQIIISAMESNLKPSTYADIFKHALSWLINWNPCQQGSDEVDGMKLYKRDWALSEWLHKCLSVVRMLVEDNKCCVPFYELLRSGLHFMENMPDDMSLFTLIFEVHRRRDMMALHMKMLDQHLHCPTFGNQRLLTHVAVNTISESNIQLRYSPITYPSVLGEPLHGEDIAFSIQRGSLDWERAIRCLRHALRNTPSPDWWRRVLMVAPCNRPNPQGSTPGAVFSSDMFCEATIERVVELLKLTNSDVYCWQDWLIFSDVFLFLVKSGCMDFVDFVDKLALCLSEKDPQVLRTNHVTWLFTQIIRVELVVAALTADSRKVEIVRKLLSFHKETRSLDSNNPQSILLDYICSCQTLRIWAQNSSVREYLNNEQLLKGKEIDEWWRQVKKGEYMMDYMNLDDKSIGMLGVVSYTMSQPVCEMVMSWLTRDGYTELPDPNQQANVTITVRREVNLVPLSLLSGFSINLCLKLAFEMEDNMFSGVHAPNIATVETYTRLLLIQPHSLFRSHLSHLHQKNPEIFNKPGPIILVLEILNYRLFPLYRYHGKNKTLMYDVTKILSTLKGKRGEHRAFRLAENLCMNLILSFREFFFVRKDTKGPTEFTETLNRITVMTLAIIIKTRGISDAGHLLYLQAMLEQILANSTHTWSHKTLFYFPPVLRDALIGKTDKRPLAIQAWKQAEATVIHQCRQLLSPPDDHTYVMTYISHSFPQHRLYLCAGAWVLMHGHPNDINTGNLGRVLREFSPEEVTSNIYTMVDIILYNIQQELQQHPHSMQDVISNTCENLAQFIWIHELLPLDILLLALTDRDDDPYALRMVVNLLERKELQQRISFYIANRGNPDHWLQTGVFKRVDLQKALGAHLSWNQKYPTYFDDIAARLLPVIPLIIYRLIENNATEAVVRILQLYSSFLHYYPLHFTFVRDILAYFYGHLPAKLIFRILNVLDVKKIPFSKIFQEHINSPDATFPSPEYFTSLLLNLVNNVIPPLHNSKGEGQNSNFNLATNQSGSTDAFEPQKAFYQTQDPGTHTQLILETAVIEILSLPVSTAQIISAFVQMVVKAVKAQPNRISPSSSDSCSKSNGSSVSCGPNPLTTGFDRKNFVLVIQACGLLLAQLPVEFHIKLYEEVSRVIKDNELQSVVGYSLLDPTLAAQDNTSTALGNVVALIHAFFSNLPQQWLDNTHLLIHQLRPVSSVSMLRIVFRIIGPLLPILANAHGLFIKTLELLLSVMVDVFGKNAKPSTPVEASDITDLIDFLHHVVHYEGQGGPVQPNSKPRPDVLALCGKAIECMRSDVQCLLSHLKPDRSSVLAATHPRLSRNPS
ncbi:mediator of RNA polymerase II transcription subunit 23-like [Bidens hawaiensis]|uniref:mediator of RNA polymerase II transcription subunit 23-like n=1 Tax=Bidens hawaiensis TaxID=980011 RepID=UPI00404A3C3D